MLYISRSSLPFNMGEVMPSKVPALAILKSKSRMPSSMGIIDAIL